MSESFEINIETLADTKAVKALQEALDKISEVLASFIGVSKNSTSATKEQSQQFEILSTSVDENTQSHKKNQEQQEKSRQSQDDNTKSSKNQSKQFQETRTQVDLLSSAFQGMGISLGMLATNGLSKIPSLIKSALGEYAEQEVAQVRLQSVLESTNQAYDGNFEKLNELASQMEILTNADGKQVLAMESVAVAMGVSAEQMEEVIKGAVGLSKAYNMDLSLAVKASSAAIQGKTDLLTRYIPTLSELSTEEEKLAEVQNKQAIGYQAAIAEMQTFQGSMTALGHSVGALSEVFGEAFAPRVQAMAKALSSLSRTLSECKGVVVGVTKVVGTFVALLVAKKIASFTGEITGLSLAFRKVSMACALTGKSMNVFAKSAAATKLAVSGLSVAFKAFLKSTAVLFAVSLAFEGICFAVDKLRNNTVELTDEQKNLQKELEKTAQASQNFTKTELARIEKTGLSEEEHFDYVTMLMDKRLEANERYVKAHKEGVDTTASFEEMKAYDALIEKVEKLKDVLDETYQKRNNANLAQAELIKEEALAKLRISKLSTQEKLNSLVSEESQLLKIIENAENSKLSTKGEIAIEEAKALGDAISRLFVVRQEKSSLDSVIKLEKERKAQAEAYSELEKEREKQAQSQLNFDLAILKAKAQGNDAEVAKLERIASLENLSKQYKAQGIKNDQEALRLAEDKLALEEQITNAQIAQTQAKAKEEFLAEYAIKKARADGDETLARSLELQKDANDLANKLGVEYDEALNALRALGKAEEDRNNKNKKSEKKVEYAEKDVAFAKKIVERGARGSTGQKAVDQAQAIVDGKEIEGQEYAMFSGVKKRSKVTAENDSQIDDNAYAAARKLGSGNAEQNPATPAQNNQAQVNPQTQVQSTTQPVAQQSNQAQPTEANAPASSPADSQSKDSGSAEIVKALSELLSAIKDLSKKLDSSNKTLTESQSTLDEILITAQAEYQ